MEKHKITLLEKAKEIPNRGNFKPISSEEIELALAWANNEITLTQAARAYGIDRRMGVSQAYNRLALALREYIRKENQK